MPGGGAAEGFVEGDGDAEVSFVVGAGDGGDVAVERGCGVGSAVDLDREAGA